MKISTLNPSVAKKPAAPTVLSSVASKDHQKLRPTVVQNHTKELSSVASAPRVYSTDDSKNLGKPTAIVASSPTIQYEEKDTSKGSVHDPTQFPEIVNDDTVSPMIIGDGDTTREVIDIDDETTSSSVVKNGSEKSDVTSIDLTKEDDDESGRPPPAPVMLGGKPANRSVVHFDVDETPTNYAAKKSQFLKDLNLATPDGDSIQSGKILMRSFPNDARQRRGPERTWPDFMELIAKTITPEELLVCRLLEC